MNLLSTARPHLFHTSTSRVAVPRTYAHLITLVSYTPVIRCGRLLRWQSRRWLYADVSRQGDIVPFRKRLKDEAKLRKASQGGSASANKSRSRDDERLKQWELTVGIEIHAELNTARKLFSPAATSISDEPNTHVAHFDAALPGSQPVFQRDTLLPALRAAIALKCEVQHRSTFDRKHYFYQDQPAGYQITQYYEPFARDGHLVLYTHDGIAPEDGPSISIPIKQIQMEQDTAKTLHQPPSTYLLDFNRVSHPLIEIISMPAIHHPATAAAYVRKIQSILKSVNACTAGMELGGLRADVNVSIKRRHVDGQQLTESATHHSYAGFTGLGQRTEIKNLSSFKAVEDAIVAERDRQIEVLEAGGVIEGETRGFTIGASGTRRLRGKEGEIDYRYMPDPDISPVFIGDDLMQHLRDTLPALPDAEVDRLVDLGVTPKDARTLVSLDDGDRLEYYHVVLDRVQGALISIPDIGLQPGKMVANWVIHELGSHLTASGRTFSAQHVPAPQLASLLTCLILAEIKTDTARSLFARMFNGEKMPWVPGVIKAEGLQIQSFNDDFYDALAAPFVEANPDIVKAIKEKGQVGKIMWFVGQVMRNTEEGKAGKLEAKRAELAVRRLLGIKGKS